MSRRDLAVPQHGVRSGGDFAEQRTEDPRGPSDALTPGIRRTHSWNYEPEITPYLARRMAFTGPPERVLTEEEIATARRLLPVHFAQTLADEAREVAWMTRTRPCCLATAVTHVTWTSSRRRSTIRSRSCASGRRRHSRA